MNTMGEAVEIIMPRVRLGTQGLEVSKLGLGCMGLTGIYNAPVAEEEGIALIKEAFSKGVTFFDTSDIYGMDHANEFLVGKALKHLPREKIQIATKFGIYKFEPTKLTVKGTPEYVRSCCEASLKRLQVDYIDLYYVHRIDITVPIEETMGELKKLVEEGKIKYIGLSEAHPETIRRAHTVHPITAVQQEYSLWTRDIEDDIIPVCRELGIGIVPYGPVGRGLFAGKAVVESLPANSFLVTHPRFTGENLEKNKSIFFRLEGIAKKHGCTPAQLAISWVLHQGGDIAPIPDLLKKCCMLVEDTLELHAFVQDSRCRSRGSPSLASRVEYPGTTKIKNLHDNIGSVTVKLTEEDIKELSDAVRIGEVAGPRIGEALLKTSYKYAITPPPRN